MPRDGEILAGCLVGQVCGRVVMLIGCLDAATRHIVLASVGPVARGTMLSPRSRPRRPTSV